MRTNLSPNRVPCACWRLARELDGVIDFLNARHKVELTFENMNRLFVPTAGGLCEMPNALHFELRRHRVFGECHLPARTATDTECIRCRALPLDSAITSEPFRARSASAARWCCVATASLSSG